MSAIIPTQEKYVIVHLASYFFNVFIYSSDKLSN